jgi:hypothetical protein
MSAVTGLYCRMGPAVATFMAPCTLQICLFGKDYSGAASLLSADEVQRVHSVHAIVQKDCSVGGEPDADAVSRCEAVGRVVAEVAATSTAHRVHAAKCAVGNFRGVCRRGRRHIARMGISLGKDAHLGTFDSKEEAARRTQHLNRAVH